MDQILRSALSDAGALTGAPEPFRTDINPALLYYRSFLVAPDLAADKKDFLLKREWRGQRLPEGFGLLLGCFNAQFGLVRNAAQSRVSCNWGIDMSPGPATLLPHLSRVKAIAQAGKLRVMWDLQQDLQDEARKDLLATYALARNIARDGVLISALVQFACESIDCLTIAENFGRFSAETLQQLLRDMDNLPARQTIADCIPAEKVCVLDWLLRKIVELRQANADDEPKIMEGFREYITGLKETELEQNDLWRQFMRASGGTVDGVLDLLQHQGRVFDRAATLLALPYHEFLDQVGKFVREHIENSTNLFAGASLPTCITARGREFKLEAWTAMVRAAVEYKLHGETGLRSVKDPYGEGPFAFERFAFEGVDRGFLLRSAYDGIPPATRRPEALIFVEKEGPAFHVDGHKAGQALESKAVGLDQPNR